MAYSYVEEPLDRTIRSGVIRRDSDGAFVPEDPDNVDWVAYKAWLAAGNTPTGSNQAPSPAPVDS